MGEPDERPRPPDPDFLPPTRAEMQLLRRAGRGRWAVPDLVKAESIFQLAAIVARGTKRRLVISAARTLGFLDKIDQADDRIELAREKLRLDAVAAGLGNRTLNLSDLTAEAEAAAREHRAARAAGEDEESRQDEQDRHG